MTKKIEVLTREVRLTGVNDQDYVCLTDIARYKDAERTDYLISNWLRNRNTIAPSTFSVSGSRSTTRILNPSNSAGLKNWPASTALP